MPNTRREDEPAILIFVDILGFREVTKLYRVRVQEHGPHYSRTTEIQRQINCFNRIISSSVSETSGPFGTQAMLFSDCAFLVFSKSVPDEYPAVRVGLVATDLMRKFIKNRVPVRMGIGKGTFYDLEYLTTTDGKLITSKSRFIGTAVICAHDAEQCGGKGLRIFVDESAEEDLPRMGRSLRLPQPHKSVKWELDYLYDPEPERKQQQLEHDDRELFDNVASMNAPGLADDVRLHYTETLDALNRMRIKNNRKPFPVDAMPNDDQFHHGYYCIAYLDILGQRRKLRELAHLSLKNEDARKLVIETSGYVLGLRNQLNTAFEGLRQLTPVLDRLPAEVRERIRAAKNIVKYRGFSDSLIMSVRFEGDAEQFGPMTGVFGCLAACSILHLVALAGKRPIRGGIDVGYGLNLTEEETYGPVLESAHFLESQIADYPRIVVGEGLPRYLDTVEREAPATPFGKAARQLATRCKEYLTTDSDGVEMLDVLGVVASLGEPEKHKALVQQAIEYIGEQHQHGIDTDDRKHRSRYFRLGAYFKNRAELWTHL